MDKQIFLKHLLSKSQSVGDEKLNSLFSAPICPRVQYNLSVLCFNFFADSCPDYFSEPFFVSQPDTYALRRTIVSYLVLSSEQTCDHRSCSYFATKQWDSLPFLIRHK